MRQVILKFLDHEVGKDLWLSKSDLFAAFMGGFHDFILKNGGEAQLREKGLLAKKDFLAFASYWCNDEVGCYDLGFSFHKYYLIPNGDIDIKKQDESAYLGYLYHNNLFRDFLRFLVSFFAYWRNDEGCTTFIPYNHADNLFVSSWAALVDTGKLFCLDCDTVYSWQSFRVKYCLNHIPGVILSDFHEKITFSDLLPLPEIKVAGYKFLGWYDKNQVKVDVAKDDMVVYAKLERRDFYDYWENEAKKIKKEDDGKRRIVDPA